MKHKVTLRPSGTVVEIEEGVNLLQALRDEGIYIKSSCGGVASCSDCIVKITSGEDYLTPPPFSELKLLGNVFHITKERLSCQTCITGDVTLDISRHDKATDQEKLKNKTSSVSKKFSVKIKKESDKKKADELKNEQNLEQDEQKKTQESNWQKHWEKNQEGPKKLAGNKRPKFFDTSKVDYDKKDTDRTTKETSTVLRKKENTDHKETQSIEKKDFKKFRT